MTEPLRENLLRDSLRKAGMAAKRNLVPGLLLQVTALAIVVSYYFFEPARYFFIRIADLKAQFGFLFSIVSTAFFAGLLPFVFLRMQKSTRSAAPYNHLLFFLLFWAFKGFEVDVLYRLQAYAFGTEVSPGVVIMKLLIDQFVYMPLWGGPTLIILFYWKDNSFDFGKTAGLFNRRFFRDTLLPFLIPNWAVWVPAVLLIYCLPLPLQVPMQNLIACMWMLVVTVLLRKEDR